MKFSCIFVITFWCTLYMSAKSNAMRVENFVIQPADEGSNVIKEDNSETDSSDLDRNDSIPISGDQSFVIQSDDEGFNDIMEENFETDTSDQERMDKKTVSGDKNFGIQPEDEGFNVISENNPEAVSSDMQRKGKNKKPSFERNCLDLKKKGKSSGAYLIKPCDDTPSKLVNVYCDMDTDGGGWTVIQRRDNYPEQQDFFGTWFEYAVGFGDITKDFWLGNDNIHCLTEQSQNEIRFDLEDMSTGNTTFANYRFFYIDDRANKYKLDVQNYTGNAGDSFSYHNNMTFTTYDADNDLSSSNCAVSSKGAWWYRSCQLSNLNGMYNGSTWNGVRWYYFNRGYSLKKSEIKIRPKH